MSKTSMAMTAAERKSKEKTQKNAMGLLRRSYWLDEKSLATIEKIRKSNSLKSNDEALTLLIELASRQLD
ncbi:hypothetical protein [Acinetobacter sp. TGL-Y2]|uniref:hypothetical protein n=1 Tax=Acinetobacter sp. TGL-Y2 TaxID=1407071 RepID=UPI000A599DD3|nr:hypothetical protein [Acinetobacter sp. TGL-Y2]